MLKATVFSSMSSACHTICGLQDPFDFRSVKRRRTPGDTTQQTTVGWHNHTFCAHENQTSAEALRSDFEIRTAPPFFFSFLSLCNTTTASCTCKISTCFLLGSPATYHVSKQASISSFNSIIATTFFFSSSS